MRFCENTSQCWNEDGEVNLQYFYEILETGPKSIILDIEGHSKIEFIYVSMFKKLPVAPPIPVLTFSVATSLIWGANSGFTNTYKQTPT